MWPELSVSLRVASLAEHGVYKDFGEEVDMLARKDAALRSGTAETGR